jgi:outer membrane protein assembly factor BamD (BamD/ComL family)
LKLEPYSYQSRLGLASIAWEQGDRREAERALKKTLATYPGQPYANYLLSVSSWRRGAQWTALVHAARAAAGNLKNKEYQRWYQHVQDTLAGQPALPAN